MHKIINKSFEFCCEFMDRLKWALQIISFQCMSMYLINSLFMNQLYAQLKNYEMWYICMLSFFETALWISVDYMLGKKYMTRTHGLLVDDITISLDSLFAALKARNEIFVNLVIWLFTDVQSTKQTRDGIRGVSPMYSYIEQIIARYYYTLLHCNDPFAFTMLPRRHMLIRNDFLHCWWPSWCFAWRTNWLQSCDCARHCYISRIIGGNI